MLKNALIMIAGEALISDAAVVAMSRRGIKSMTGIKVDIATAWHERSREVYTVFYVTLATFIFLMVDGSYASLCFTATGHGMDDVLRNGNVVLTGCPPSFDEIQGEYGLNASVIRFT